jgi:signal peptidase I
MTAAPVPAAPSRAIRAARPAVALILGLLTPGLGQIYTGRLLRGVGAYLLLSAAVFVLSPLAETLLFPGFLIWTMTPAILDIVYVIEAFLAARRAGDRFVPRSYNTWVVYVGVVLLHWIVLVPAARTLARALLPVATYVMPSDSMSPALDSYDFFVGRKWPPGRDVARGDVLVFRFPDDPKVEMVKRVIGLGGDTLEIRSKTVLVGGRPLHDPWGRSADAAGDPSLDDYGPVAVPPGHVFVLGDNRDNSVDSRFFGPVSREGITAKVLYVYFSRDVARIGRSPR